MFLKIIMRHLLDYEMIVLRLKSHWMILKQSLLNKIYYNIY